MSEYQYYEFVAVDHPLDARQQREMRELSTRARITPTRFVNTYHWGDFKGDPRALVSRYYDAFLYLANWGTRQFMIQLPSSHLQLEVVSRYCATDAAHASLVGDKVIIELTSEKEDEYSDEGAEESLDCIVPVRAELAAGDLRLLYLGWLLSVSAGELEDGDREPPVPSGLATLSMSLQVLVEFLRFDEDLLAVAAQASEPLNPVEPSADELTRWIAHLPDEEKDSLLARLVGGETHLGPELLRRFRSESEPTRETTGTRTVADLLNAARKYRERREQVASERRAQEQFRRERAEGAARERRLNDVAGDQEQVWQQVRDAIDTRQSVQYDAAVKLLEDLRTVSEREGRREAFDRRFADLCQRHSKKYTLLQRLERIGFGASTNSVRGENDELRR